MGKPMLTVSWGPTYAVWWLQLVYTDLAASVSNLLSFPHSKEQNERGPVMSLELTWFNSAYSSGANLFSTDTRANRHRPTYCLSLCNNSSQLLCFEQM